MPSVIFCCFSFTVKSVRTKCWCLQARARSPSVAGVEGMGKRVGKDLDSAQEDSNSDEAFPCIRPDGYVELLDAPAVASLDFARRESANR